MDRYAVKLYQELKLSNTFLKEYGTPLVTCGKCGRGYFTKEQYKKHVETKCGTENQ